MGVNRIAHLLGAVPSGCGSDEFDAKTYERVGYAVFGYLDSRRSGEAPTAEEFILGFPEHEQPLARRCFETAVALMDLAEFAEDDEMSGKAAS